MKSIGIIAEYNPFHNGHYYHLTKIKEKYPDYKIILVMSGNFTERGEPTIIDKWKRCEIALKLGIDLVVELPYPFATQSADYFAYGAITILEKLQVEKLIFGSESDNIEDLTIIAETELYNDEFDKLVKIYSKLGNNYPTAISNAIYDLTKKTVTTPNDLLGVSYLKTILKNNYHIKAETIKRTNNYHERELTSNISSASAIREALKNNQSVNNYVPKEVLPYLKDFHFKEDYFNILKYKIITEENLKQYNTVDEGLDKVLKKAIEKSSNYEDLIKLIKTKRYTYNKISRMLNHILCNFTINKKHLMKDISYIRILGFNDLGRTYLKEIKKDLDIPIISKITKEKDMMLDFEIETTKIYDIIKNTNLVKKEFEKIIYLKENEND